MAETSGRIGARENSAGGDEIRRKWTGGSLISARPVGGTHPGNLEIDILEPGDERLMDTLDIIVFGKDFMHASCMLETRPVRRNGQDGNGLFIGALPVFPLLANPSVALGLLPFLRVARRVASAKGRMNLVARI